MNHRETSAGNWGSISWPVTLWDGVPSLESCRAGWCPALRIASPPPRGQRAGWGDWSARGFFCPCAMAQPGSRARLRFGVGWGSCCGRWSRLCVPFVASFSTLGHCSPHLGASPTDSSPAWTPGCDVRGMFVSRSFLGCLAGALLCSQALVQQISHHCGLARAQISAWLGAFPQMKT